MSKEQRVQDHRQADAPSFWQKLERRKVTPLIVLLFFLVLATMSGLAAGIGYLTHHVLR